MERYKGFNIERTGYVIHKITSFDGRIKISGFLSIDDAKKYIDRKYIFKK